MSNPIDQLQEGILQLQRDNKALRTALKAALNQRDVFIRNDYQRWGHINRQTMDMVEMQIKVAITNCNDEIERNLADLEVKFSQEKG